VTATATRREGVRAGLKSTGRGLSLAARILLITGVLILLAVGAAVAITSLLAQRVAQRTVREDLQRSAAVQAAFERHRYERLGLISRVFVGDAALTAYLAEAAGRRDTGSLLDLLDERQSDLGFDFAILLDPEGHVVARTDRPDAVGGDLSRRPLIAKAVEEFQAAGVWQEGHDLFYAVAVPVTKDFTLLGYLVSGFKITREAAEELEEVSRTDVAFVSHGGGEVKIAATTLPPAPARELEEWLAGERETFAGREAVTRQVALAGQPWLAQVTPLRDAAGGSVGATVALASLTPALAPFRQIEMALLGAGLAAVLLALALTWFFTRRALRPVERLAAAAEAAREGQYDQRIEAERGDEVGRLAQAFNELMAELREKRDMERYVTELSRNLPEPVPAARAAVGPSEERSVLLMAVELRRYAAAKADSDPRKPLELLSRDLRRLANAAAARRGRLETIAGHRALLSFEGPARAFGALAVAGELLDGGAGGESTLVALAAGKVISGPVHWREQPEQGLVGLPVQQLESLLREAAPGDIVLSREVYQELHEQFTAAGYELAERRGLVSTQPLYVLDGAVAARVSGVQPVTAEADVVERGEALASVAPDGQPTLSGIAPGSLLGQRFEILSVLGAGGMGIVYKAQDRELDDLVALKMLKRELWGDQSQLERLKSEIKLARKITHPNVLRTYDFGEIDGVPYISMEYVRGVTLRYLLDETERLPYSAGLRLAKQLCAGLAAAHAVGVLHRDIKPENLILEATGNAKLMDFGIARPERREGPGQTQAGWVVGTPQYLAPEQLQGQESDARADIYSCGIVLYELFTGRLPFAGATPVEIMFQALKEEPAPPRAAWPEVPPRLEAAILRCLEKDPAARYPAVADLLHDLEGLSA
jgi:serine/threonine-protein kinase